MREEIIKFDRYQKQFHFLIDNDIETIEQINVFKESAESKIKELTLNRSRLYNKPDAKPEIEKINKELRELRKDVFKNIKIMLFSLNNKHKMLINND